MELIADGVLILAAFVATAYCMVLSRRLRRLSELDGGLGGAITALSREVDHLSTALAEAKTATTDSATDLSAQCRAANVAARRLEALVSRANKPPQQSGAERDAPAERIQTERAQAEQTVTMKTDPPAVKSAKTPPVAEKSATPEPIQNAAAENPERTKEPPAPSAADTPKQASGDNDAVDAKALDKFISAIVANSAEGDNAVLARRLVMALAAGPERTTS